MSRRNSMNETVVTIKLQKGLADRRRLPLAHVIALLEEVRQMISDVGRDLEHQKGVLNPTGDFGLEVLAGTSGIIFRPGSIQTNLVITQNVQIGILAAQRVINTVGQLEREELPSQEDEISSHIVRRLNKMARIQETDKIETLLSVKRPGYPKPMHATFGSVGIAAARSLQAPTFRMEDLTLYGKLFGLSDRSMADDETGKVFWGELRRENGEVWRIQFKAEDVSAVSKLFRRQVAITGTAFYYRVASPKLVAERFDIDQERDFESAFDSLFGCYKESYKADFITLLKKMHGED